MNKKVSIILVVVGISILIFGCSASSKPETTVSEFIKGMKGFDLELMASKINPANVVEKNKVSNLFEDDEDQFQKYFSDYIKSNAQKIDYEITDTKVDGDSAVVSVDFEYVDASQLFRATFAEYIREMFSLAILSDEISEEYGSKVFIETMQKQNEQIDELFVKKTVDIECIKIDKQWYIDKPSENLLDVFMSNILSVSKDLEDTFDSGNGANEPETVMEQLEADNMSVIERGIGDEITLATIKFKVTKVEEMNTLTARYGSPTVSKEGAKFVLVSMDITNTTKSEFSMPPDFMLVDNQEREFSTYSDSIGAIDDYMNYRDLSPGIKENGRFIYEVPSDSTSYFLIMAKAGTNDVYKIILK